MVFQYLRLSNHIRFTHWHYSIINANNAMEGQFPLARQGVTKISNCFWISSVILCEAIECK